MPTSQNGWPVVTDSGALTPLKWVTGRVLPGDVHAVFSELCRRFNAEVEPITQAHSWGWAYRPIRGASGGYSNHASGTAIDLNAPRHPLGATGTFTAKQVTRIRAILADLDGVIRWGGDYSGRKDAMHFEVVGTRAQVHRIALALDAALKVVVYNVKEGRGDAAGTDVAKLIDAYAPEVLILAETAGNRVALRRVLRGKYSIFTGTGREGASTWIAVRKGIKITRTAMLATRRVWIGPKGRRRIGRTLPLVVVRLDGVRVRIVGVHQVWSPRSKNKHAAAGVMALLHQSAPPVSVPLLMAGDWNVDDDALGDGTPRRFARQIGAEVIETGDNLMYAVARGLTAKAIVGPAYRSDHPAVVLNLKLKENPK